MKQIDVYDNKFMMFKDIDKQIYKKFIVLLVSFFLILIFLILFDYPDIYAVEGFVSEDKVVVSIDRNDLEKFSSDVLKIDGKTHKYSVFSYEYMNENSMYSNDVLLTLLLDEKFKNNQVVSLTIENGKTNLFRSFVKKLWKGF